MRNSSLNTKPRPRAAWTTRTARSCLFPSFRFRILLLRLTLPPSSLSGHGLRTSYNGTPRPTIRNRDQDLADILLFFPLVRRTILNLSGAGGAGAGGGGGGAAGGGAGGGAGAGPK